ncbi:hypothetical protein [Helicobacter bizzozeronii]|nr:hypothetical protein [Helicobacter bizzozeronii]
MPIKIGYCLGTLVLVFSLEACTGKIHEMQKSPCACGQNLVSLKKL